MHTASRLAALAASWSLVILSGCGGAAGSTDDPGPGSPTFELSGRITGATAAGVTVTLGGTATASTTTDATGVYVFGGLAEGRYTVTPSKSGHVFSPASLSVALSDADASAPTTTAHACSADGWCWENPLPQGNSLRAAWLASPTEGWAVGNGGTALRWDGHDWSKAATDTTKDLYGVWGRAADDVWAVGFAVDGPTNRAVAIHWDGGRWSTSAGLDTYQLFGVWGAAPDDVWAVGYGIWHWDGAAWTVAANVTGVNAVWGSGPDDVWAVGDDGTITHWNGSAWSSVQSPVVPRWDWLYGFTMTPNLYDVWGSSASDVWAVGSHGTIVHWDGAAWSDVTGGSCAVLQEACSVTSDARCGDTGLCCDASCGGAEAYTYKSVWGSASDDVWALDVYTEQSQGVLHWDGAAWERVPMEGVHNLLGIGGTSATEALAVGARGDLVRWDGAAWTARWVGTTETLLGGVWGSSDDDLWAVGTSGVILRWNGVEWTSVTNPRTGVSNSVLEGVWGASASDVWAVGSRATILHWDGAEWSSVANPLEGVEGVGSLANVWGSASDDVWAVGWGGALHWDGASWSASALPAGWSLQGVWGSAADDVWVVGSVAVDPETSVGGILHWDGSGWTVARQEGMPLSFVWGRAADDVWAVGQSGEIVHWDGAGWSDVPSGVTTRLEAIWASSETDAWAGGAGGLLLHWDGLAWTPVRSGSAGYDVNAIWGSSAADVRAVGGWGMILRYRP